MSEVNTKVKTEVKDGKDLIQDQSNIPEAWKLKVVVNDDNLSYILGNTQTKELVIVDPVQGDVELTQSVVNSEFANYRVLMVHDTHTHADHISSAADLAKIFQVPLVQHQLSPSQRINLRVSRDTEFPCAAGGLKLLLTPGHTADSITLIWGPFLFGADTFLYGDTGRDDLPGGDPKAHWQSIQKVKKHVLPETLVLPGHDGKGGRISSWKHQVELNPSLSQDEKTFVEDAGAWTGPAPKLLKESLFYNFK